MNKHSKIAAACRLVALSAACLAGWPGVLCADVRFSGLDAAQEANARALMPIVEADCATSRWRVERLFRDADENLENALRALGYYGAEISKELDWEEDCWVATFDVTVGDPVRYRTVDVRVDDEPIERADMPPAAVDRLPHRGDILNHGEYERLKRSIVDHFSNQGYFDAEFKQSEVVVDPETASADLYLYLDSGSRYRFGDITFSEGILRESLLRRYTDVQEGDYFSAVNIAELYESLNGSGYFGSVSIRTDTVDKDSLTVPLRVSLTPGKRRVYTAGAGFSTDTGPQGRLGYINRRRNDKGHQFEARLLASKTDSELTGFYRWPVRDPRTDWMSIVGGFQHQDTDTAENDTFTIGVLRTKRFSQNWIWTRYADYAYEDFTIGEQDDTSQLVILGTGFESAIGREVSRSTAGRRLSLDIRGSSDWIASDTSFLQVTANAKWLYSLSDKTRLFLRGKLGTTVKEDLTELPASVRFFAGGDRSVRGYDFESLGPVDSTGAVIGGSHIVEASIEFDRLVRGNWTVAAFVDTGSAFSSDRPEFSTGVGVGLRWYSPVGPVRFDIAHPLDDPDRDFRLHITLGPDL